MTVFTASSGGITVKADDGDITDVSFLLDLDMRTGTLVDSTEWLKGYGSTYPGGSDMSTFAANNTDGAAEGGLRLLVLELDLESANAEPLIFTEGVDKIVAILGCNMPAAVPDKTVAVSFTDTGVDNGSSAPAATGGALPALNFHAEAAVDNLQISLLVLA
tara:strand:- start:409 stop:891 length:483 start_codon:yes stop_codon:yes gene_type:complete